MSAIRTNTIGPRQDFSVLSERNAIIALAALGGLLALIWLVGLTIPASIIEYQAPIKWTAPIAIIFGQDTAGLIRFGVIQILLWVVYVAGVLTALRLRSQSAVRVAVGIGVLLTVLAVMTYPAGSRDFWHNVADGRLIVVHGQNPLITTPYVYNRLDPVMASMSAWDFVPNVSYYGPAWYIAASVLAFFSGDSLFLNLLLFKLTHAVAFVVSLLLVYRIAEKVRPGSGLVASIIFGWNPLMLWAAPMDGHNDIFMVVFLLGALHETLSRRYETAIPLLFLGVLFKYTGLLLLPVIVVYALRVSGRQSLSGLAMGFVAGLAISVLMWIPFWQGTDALKSLSDGSSGTVQSPMAALLYLVKAERDSILEVPTLFRIPFTLAFLIISGILLLRLLFFSPSLPMDMLRTALTIFLIFLYVALWWFWPNYLMWVLPLAAILVSRTLTPLTIVFSASAMAIVMFHGWWWTLVGPDQAPYNISVALAVFAPPLVFLAVNLVRQRMLPGQAVNDAALERSTT